MVEVGGRVLEVVGGGWRVKRAGRHGAKHSPGNGLCGPGGTPCSHVERMSLPWCIFKVLLKLCSGLTIENNHHSKKNSSRLISMKFKLMSGDTEDRGGSSLIITKMEEK